MTMKGGNTTELYKADGRLNMAKSLERMWPKIVSVKRRFKRPQHVIKGNWRMFRHTQLKLKKGIDKESMLKNDEYGMTIKAIGTVKSARIKKMLMQGEQS
jgi:hypothetical protein